MQLEKNPVHCAAGGESGCVGSSGLRWAGAASGEGHGSCAILEELLMVRFIQLQRNNYGMRDWRVQQHSDRLFIILAEEMGCFQDKPLQKEQLSINGILILDREPTFGRHSQTVEIAVVLDDRLRDTLEDAPVRVLEQDYKLTLALPTDSPEIQPNSLTPAIMSILKRANRANKSTLLMQQPSFGTDDPLITKSITKALFRQFAIALADFASRVDLRSLQWVYFQWEREEVAELYGAASEEIRSMRVLIT